MARLTLLIGTLGAIALLVAAAVLLRQTPRPLPPLSLPPPGVKPPAPPAATPSAPEVVVAPEEGVDNWDVPLDSKRAAREVEEMARAYAEVRDLLKRLPPGEELYTREIVLGRDVRQWIASLVHRKAWGFRELFARLLRDDDYFKHDAAYYLAALPDGAGIGALKEALEGTSLYARSAAADGLYPYLTDDPGPLLPAFRKALSDDLSIKDENALYGSTNHRYRELAEKLRGVAVAVVARAGDVESTAALVDLLVAKDGLDWWAPHGSTDGDRLYKLLAKGLAKEPPPLALERMEGMIDAHLAAQLLPPPGDAFGAALLLDGLGRPAKLREMREHYHARLLESRNRVDYGSSLLALCDTRGLNALLDGLTDPESNVRGRASELLGSHTGQKLTADKELSGSGTAEDVARWSQVRQRWSDWCAQNRRALEVNPYAPR
ncbi:MAG TPA: hypothetical protein VF950_16720 [Planctomycetota bacterium]